MQDIELDSIIDWKNLYGKLFVIFMNILFIYIFFSTRDLFNSNYFLYIDHGGFNSLVVGLGDVILPEFKSTYGFSDDINCGYPVLPLFPLGFFYLIVLISYLGIGYAISYKIILAIILFLWGTLPYFIVKKNKGSDLAAILTVLWFWTGFQFFWLARISTGALESLLSGYLCYIFLHYTNRIDFAKVNHIFYNKHHIFLTFLLFFIAFVNFSYCFFIAVFVIEDILIKLINRKKIDQEIKNEIQYFIILSIFAIAIFSFWLLPTIFIHFKYLAFNESNFLYQFQFSLKFNLNYFQNNFIGIFLIVLSIVYLKIEKISLPMSSFFSRLLFSSSIIVFVLPFFNIPFFNGVNTYRYVFFFELSGIFYLGISFSYLISTIKRIFKKLRVKSLIGNKERNFFIQNIIFIIFIIMAFIDIIPIRPYHNTYRNSLLGSPEINYSSWNENDIELIDWIKLNTNQDSRILFQNSGDISKFQLSGGHNVILMALQTERKFATGFTVELFWNYSKSNNFMDNILYGKNLTEYSIEDLEYYFYYFNIEYIIVWSDLAKNFFNNITLESNLLENLHNTVKYSFYQYKYARKNYVICSNDISIKNLNITRTLISFNLLNISNNRLITYSLHDYPNWKVIINGNIVEKIENPLGLISFLIPQNFNDSAYIEIEWEKNKIENISDFISIGSIFITLGSPKLYQFFKIKKKK